MAKDSISSIGRTVSILFTLLGLTISTIGMVDFMFYFKNLQAFCMMSMFFLISCGSLIIILRTKGKSRVFFYVTFALYIAVLVLTGILLPLTTWPGVLVKMIVTGLSALVLVGFISLVFCWKNYSLGSGIYIAMISLEWAVAIITVLSYSQSLIADEKLLLWTSFLRPVAITALYIAYGAHHKSRYNG